MQIFATKDCPTNILLALFTLKNFTLMKLAVFCYQMANKVLFLERETMERKLSLW